MTSSGNALWKAFLPLIVILALVVGGLYAVKSRVHDASSKPAVEIRLGSILPDFRLEQFATDGKFVQASELKSKVTLINFWATWCEACMVEMPSILKLRESFLNKGFDVVAVDVDQHPEAVLPKTLKKLGIDFPVFMDKDQKLADLFQIQAIPLTVVIDRNRKILFIENGERDWNGSDIRAELEKWLAG